MRSIAANRRLWELMVRDGWDLPAERNLTFVMVRVPSILVPMFGDMVIVIGYSNDSTI